jgi:hypothetical protein
MPRNAAAYSGAATMRQSVAAFLAAKGPVQAPIGKQSGPASLSKR